MFENNEESKFVSDISKAIYNETTKPIDKIYIDLPYLQDIYLGGLLLANMNKDAFDYVLSKLDNYKQRFKISHAEYFPNLNMTEESLITYIQNNLKTCIITSPITTLYFYFEILYKDILKRNIAIDVHKTDFTIFINTYPFVLDPTHMKMIKSRLTIFNPNFIIGFISKPLDKIDNEDILNSDLWFIYDLSYLENHDSPICKKLTSNTNFQHRYIYSPKRISNPDILNKLDTFTDDTLNQILSASSFLLNVYTNFQYLDIDINFDLPEKKEKPTEDQ